MLRKTVFDSTDTLQGKRGKRTPPRSRTETRVPSQTEFRKPETSNNGTSSASNPSEILQPFETEGLTGQIPIAASASGVRGMTAVFLLAQHGSWIRRRKCMPVILKRWDESALYFMTEGRRTRGIQGRPGSPANKSNNYPTALLTSSVSTSIHQHH